MATASWVLPVPPRAPTACAAPSAVTSTAVSPGLRLSASASPLSVRGIQESASGGIRPDSSGHASWPDCARTVSPWPAWLLIVVWSPTHVRSAGTHSRRRRVRLACSGSRRNPDPAVPSGTFRGGAPAGSQGWFIQPYPTSRRCLQQNAGQKPNASDCGRCECPCERSCGCSCARLVQACGADDPDGWSCGWHVRAAPDGRSPHGPEPCRRAPATRSAGPARPGAIARSAGPG